MLNHRCLSISTPGYVAYTYHWNWHSEKKIGIVHIEIIFREIIKDENH
jgi:hypothetical protein